MIFLNKQDVEYAKRLIESGNTVCPRCDSVGNLTLQREKKIFSTSYKLRCQKCNAIWENMLSYNQEMENQCIETIKREGLTEPYPFEVPILMEKGEKPYLVRENVSFFEGRKYTYTSNSIGVSLRLAKGIWLHPRTGGGSGQSEDIMKHFDDGSLILTDKKLVFIGTKKAITTKLKDLLSVDTSSEIGEAGFLLIAKHGKQRVEAYSLLMPNLTKEFILAAHEKYIREDN